MNARSDGFPFGDDAEPLPVGEAQRLLARIGCALQDREPEPLPVRKRPPVDMDKAVRAIARAMAKPR